MEETPQNAVLIVDDSPMCVKFLMHLLKNEFKLFVAKDGHTAINIAIKNLPDLILLDVDMPDMSGYQVLSSLRALDATKNIPAIFFTSRDRPEDALEGSQLGAADYIPKGTAANVVKSRILDQINIINSGRGAPE